MTTLEKEEFIKRLFVPSLPSAILLTLGAADIAVQAKELAGKIKRNSDIKNKQERQLYNYEAGSYFLEEVLLDVVTLSAASVAINWLYRSGLKPLAWFCVFLPIALISITIALHIKKLKQHTKEKSFEYSLP